MNEYDNHEFEMAKRFIHQGLIDAAIEILRRLLAKDPTMAMYHGLLALCLVQKMRLHAAKYEIDIALHEEPGNTFIRYVNALVLKHQNQPQQALLECEDILAIDPLFVDALLLKSDICSYMGQKKQAYNCIQEALNLAPQSLEVHLALGNFHFANGAPGDAEQEAMWVLAEDAGSIDAHLLLGNIRLKQGNTEEAKYHASYVISQQPDHRGALTLFSHIKMRQNWFLGIWWRFYAWVATLGELRSSFVLVMGYVFFNLCAVALKDLGYPVVSLVVSFSWLGLVLYSWIGVPVYQRKLKSELEAFRFNSDY